MLVQNGTAWELKAPIMIFLALANKQLSWENILHPLILASKYIFCSTLLLLSNFFCMVHQNKSSLFYCESIILRGSINLKHYTLIHFQRCNEILTFYYHT